MVAARTTVLAIYERGPVFLPRARLPGPRIAIVSEPSRYSVGNSTFQPPCWLRLIKSAECASQMAIAMLNAKTNEDSRENSPKIIRIGTTISPSATLWLQAFPRFHRCPLAWQTRGKASARRWSALTATCRRSRRASRCCENHRLNFPT